MERVLAFALLACAVSFASAEVSGQDWQFERQRGSVSSGALFGQTRFIGSLQAVGSTCPLAYEISLENCLSSEFISGYSHDPISCNAPGAGPVGYWFKYTATATMLDVVASTCNNVTQGDTVIEIYKGPSCTNTTCVASLDDSGSDCPINGLFTILKFDVVAGETYYILSRTYSVSTPFPYRLCFFLNPSSSPSVSVSNSVSPSISVSPSVSPSISESSSVTPSASPPTREIFATVNLKVASISGAEDLITKLQTLFELEGTVSVVNTTVVQTSTRGSTRDAACLNTKFTQTVYLSFTSSADAAFLAKLVSAGAPGVSNSGLCIASVDSTFITANGVQPSPPAKIIVDKADRIPIGLGVGLGVGLPLIMALIIIFFCCVGKMGPALLPALAAAPSANSFASVTTTTTEGSYYSESSGNEDSYNETSENSGDFSGEPSEEA